GVETPYFGYGGGELQVWREKDPNWESFFRTRYVLPDLSVEERTKLGKKLSQAPALGVLKVRHEMTCSECGQELGKGRLVFMESEKPLCMVCADLEHLDFVGAGHSMLSRRARKYSKLSVEVLRFSRSRGRYEREGLLVEREALDRASEECLTAAE